MKHLALVCGLAWGGFWLTGSAAASPFPAEILKDSEKTQQASDISWMLNSTGLVLLMVPGLALFYGGMVRRKNVLGTMMHSMIALGLIGIQWVLFGYCLAFGASQAGWIGWSPEFLGMSAPELFDKVFPGTRLPLLLHCLYQGMFAIITPALISGAIAERVRFGPYCLFILLWSTLIYDPIAHWVWAIGADGKAAGWLGKLGAIDFAGGTVVHVAAGFGGLAAILTLRKRIGYPRQAVHPNSMVLTLTGAGLLWFGWFGFNGGSALAANALAVQAVAASQIAAAAGGLFWVAAEWYHRGKPTGLGLASGLVAGLVAVTPASGYVSPISALAIGGLAGLVCYGMIVLKPRLGYDDSLDAFGIHGVGGVLGALLTGLLANETLWQYGSGSADTLGKLSEGVHAQIAVQALATLASAAISFVGTWLLVRLIDAVWGFTLSPDVESEGLDRGIHGEAGFDFDAVDESTALLADIEPRPANEPPEGHRRFTVVVDGLREGDLAQAWSALCQPSDQPPSDDFQALYPYLTTVQGNRFRFRGGDPVVLRERLQRLLQERLEGAAIRSYIEN